MGPCSCQGCRRHEGQAKSTGDFQTHLSGRLVCRICLSFGNSEWGERVCLLSCWGSFRPAWSQCLFVLLQADEKRKLSCLFRPRTNRSVVRFSFHLLLGRKGEERGESHGSDSPRILRNPQHIVVFAFDSAELRQEMYTMVEKCLRGKSRCFQRGAEFAYGDQSHPAPAE